MLKKAIILSCLVSFVFLGVAFASELENPGLLPDHPLYFLKNWSERIGLFFKFRAEAKAEQLLYLAEKRLQEAEILAEQNKTQIAQRATLRYQEQINHALENAHRARERGVDIDDLLTRVSEATLRHQEVLSEVYEKVPEEAKEAIERAMEQSMQGHKRAIEAISLEKREEVLEQVRERRMELEMNLERIRNIGPPALNGPRGDF